MIFSLRNNNTMTGTIQTDHCAHRQFVVPLLEVDNTTIRSNKVIVNETYMH